MFDMANDSNLFRTREELDQQGWALGGNIFVKDSDRYVPLYEAKMAYFWTHRYGDYAMRPIGSEDTELPRIPAERLANPNYVIQPRYWVSQQEMEYRTSLVPPALVTGCRGGNQKVAKEVICLWAAGLRLSLQDADGADKLLKRASNWSALFDSALAGVHEHLSNLEVAKAWQKNWPLTVREVTQAGMAEHDYVGLARRLIHLRCPKWFIGFRDIARSTDERTAIFSLLPSVGVGHTAPLTFLNGSPDTLRVACFLGNVNSLVFDYATRQKIGGTHLTYNLLKQLPVLPPDTYSLTEMEIIFPRVLELVFTAWDIHAFADDGWRDSSEDLRTLIRNQWEANKAATGGNAFKPIEGTEPSEAGIPLPPFKWDEDRRAQIRAELDAYYALLYGLTRDELRYILDPKDVSGPDFPSETFRVLKEKEEKRFGEYRTRRLVLEAFDKLAESPRFRDEMPKRVSALEVS
jgi:hypothetical protein